MLGRLQPRGRVLTPSSGIASPALMAAGLSQDVRKLLDPIFIRGIIGEFFYSLVE